MRTITAHSGLVKSLKGDLHYYIQWSRETGYQMVIENCRFNLDDLEERAFLSQGLFGVYLLRTDLYSSSVLKEIDNFRGALKR